MSRPLKVRRARLSSERARSYLPDVYCGVDISVPQPVTSLTLDQPMTQDECTAFPRPRVLTFPERRTRPLVYLTQ